MRRTLIVILFSIVTTAVMAQQSEDAGHVLELLGAFSPEDVDEEEMERLLDILEHPLDINSSSRSRLESSGLFTAYQIASLTDYISRHGAVMSLTELSSVDGFSVTSVGRLAPFISTGSQGVAARRNRRPLEVEASSRSALKKSGTDAPMWNYAFRSRLTFNDAWSFSASCSRGNDAAGWYPSMFSAGLLWRNRCGTLIIGDFNARFGQGLCLWNTMTLSGLSSPSSFMKRPSGLSPSNSFTGTYAMTGIAGDVSLGKMRLSCALSSPDIKKGKLSVVQPMLNLTGHFAFGHIGVTHICAFSDIMSRDFRIPEMRSSVDASVCFRGINVFGEAVYDWVAEVSEFLSGIETSVGENITMASMLRYRPDSDEHGWMFGTEFTGTRHHAVFTSDLLYHPSGKSLTEGRAVQVKAQAKWRWEIDGRWHSEFRVTERIRTWGTPFRTDVRIDSGLEIFPWSISARLNFLKCIGPALLGYLEGAYTAPRGLKVYIRQGIFLIDRWDDRIYVYERDAPGNFNVPAFYGRGVWTSSCLSWKFARWGSLYCRISYTAYPMMQVKKKPGKAELKLQFSLHL